MVNGRSLGYEYEKIENWPVNSMSAYNERVEPIGRGNV